jgi:tetratricopeptide (TPR) repeat protein
MLEEITSLFGGQDEKGVETIERLLSDDDPDEFQRWLNQRLGNLEPSLIASLAGIAERLLNETTIDSTAKLFRLHLLVWEISTHNREDQWTLPLLSIQKVLELEGIGPRSQFSTTAEDVFMRVLNYRGCMLAERGEFMAAIEHFSLTLQLDPSFAPAYCNKARAWLELNDVEKAREECKTLTAVDPHYSVGQATTQLVEVLGRLKASRPGTISEIAEEHGLLEFLRLYDRPLKPEEEMLAQTHSLNPFEGSEITDADSTAEELNHIGVVRGRSGDYEGALQAFDQALKRKPDYMEPLFNRGRTYLLSGKHEKAIADFTMLIQRNPAEVDAYHLRAQAYREIGNTAAAEADEKRARAG